MINQSIKHIIEAMKNNTLLVFVGAGVSKNSGLPTWDEVIEVLKRDLSLGEKDNDYLKIAQFYYDTLGKQKYFEKLDSIFKEYANSQPNELHDHIFKMQPRHLITTNYDTLLEDKMNSGINKYSVIKDDSDIPYTASDRYIIKMHGDFSLKNIVFKEDDYLDYEKNFNMTSTLIKSLIMNNTILFLGYSLNDTTFNTIFRIIQNSFDGNAKKAYFYTAEKPKEPVIEYYKNKGIHVLTSGKNSVKGRDIGHETAKFLEGISGKQDESSIDSESLWNNIKFLNKFSFVESIDVAYASNLFKKASLYSIADYSWNMRETPSFNMNSNEEITKFITNKTMIQHYLDFENTKELSFSTNAILEEAFIVYKSGKYSESKRMFRDIANKSFAQKDYINFFIAEFNATRIGVSFLEVPANLSDSVIGDLQFSEVLERIITSESDENRKLAIFFRDIVNSLKFVYRKMLKINSLCDELREERSNYRRGGFSTNGNLYKLQQEFQNFIYFIESNCICIYQYKEFKTIVNKYFEALLIALSNYSYKVEDDDFLKGTSSKLSELSLKDVEMIVPYLDYKLVKVCLENYELEKITISEEALKHIFSTIDNLIENSGTNHRFSEYSIISKYIKFLSFVEILDSESLINLLKSIPLFVQNRDDIRIVLSHIIDNLKKMDGSLVKQIPKVIEGQIKKIFEENLEKTHYTNFTTYSYLLEQIAILDKVEIVMDFDFLDDIFFIIQNKKDRIKDIEHYQSFIVSFYKFLSESTKSKIDSILNKYEALPDEKINYYFVIELILRNVYKFNKAKDPIFNFLITTIKKEKNEAVEVFPDPVKNAVADLFNLLQEGYFNFDEIAKEDIDEEIQGKFPEVDWVLFNDKDDDTITRLLENRTFSEAKEAFSKSKDDEKLFDNWAIKQFNNDRVILKK